MSIDAISEAKRLIILELLSKAENESMTKQQISDELEQMIKDLKWEARQYLARMKKIDL